MEDVVNYDEVAMHESNFRLKKESFLLLKIFATRLIVLKDRLFTILMLLPCTRISFLRTDCSQMQLLKKVSVPHVIITKDQKVAVKEKWNGLGEENSFQLKEMNIT